MQELAQELGEDKKEKGDSEEIIAQEVAERFLASALQSNREALRDAILRRDPFKQGFEAYKLIQALTKAEKEVVNQKASKKPP